MADAKHKKLDLSGLHGLGDVMTGDAASHSRNYRDIPRDRIAPDPEQPRKAFHDESIKELAESIEEGGIITPIVVRPNPDKEGHFILIAGERRWRAADLAKLATLPAIVREDWREADALLENLQREDLSALDTANAIARLLADGKMKSAELARQLGKNKDWVSLYKQLSEADPILKDLYANGVLTDARAVVELARAHRKNGEPVRLYIDSLARNGEPVGRRDMADRLQSIDDEVNKPAAIEPETPASNVDLDRIASGPTGQGSEQGVIDRHADEAADREPATLPPPSSRTTPRNQPEAGKAVDNDSSSDAGTQSQDTSADASTDYTLPELNVVVSWGKGDDEQFGVILGVSSKTPDMALILCDDIIRPIEVPLDQLAVRKIRRGHH